MITISNHCKSFGVRTLFAGVSLRLNAGERYGLVGANGSGKTTFLEPLTSITALQAGHATSLVAERVCES
jgi:ATPase subunit of ABC transporter with duplicated ATPase domains